MDEAETVSLHSASPLIDAVAGAVAGMTGLLFGSPFDLLKVRMQSSPVKISILSLFSQIVQREGVRAFWKGVTPPLITEGVLNQVLFGVYSMSSRSIQKDHSIPLTVPQSTICGGLSGFCGSVLVTPTDIIKIRAQLSEENGMKRRKPLQIFKQIYAESGPIGLYRGWTSCAIRDVPGVGLYFGFYNLFRNHIATVDGSISHLHQLLAGGFAGTASWGLVYPFDVIKTRLQSTNQYRGFFNCFSQTLRVEGVPVLFKGFLPCIVRGFPVNAVVFYTYELLISVSKSFT